MADASYDPRERLLIPVDLYLAETAHLSAGQHGAFLLLLMHAWQNGALPSEDRELAAITKMTRAEWKNAKPVLLAFFADGLPTMLVGDEP